jgi:hypothetical protein
MRVCARVLGDELKGRTFKTLVEYYTKRYSEGQIAGQFCDVMDGFPQPVHAEAAQWTMDAARSMAEDKGFWKRECVSVLSDIKSVAVSYFKRQRIDPSEEILYDIVQAVILNFACIPREDK